MNFNAELLRMQRSAALDPGLTPLQARLIEDDSGTATRHAVAQFETVAAELRDLAQARGDPLHRDQAGALLEAVQAAVHTLERHWTLVHGRALPANTPSTLSNAASTRREFEHTGPQAFVDSLADCAVLAAVAADLPRGELIRRGVRAVAPEQRGHDVLYALALHFNGEPEQAELMLTELMRGPEAARAASALGFVLQTRGDDRWRQLFERARRATGAAEVRGFVEFWTRVADEPAH